MTKPPGRFVPTEASLALSAHVAAALGIEFSVEGTQNQAATLHQVMFNDMLAVLSIDPSTIKFEPGAYRYARTYVQQSGASSSIVFDESFDFWIFALTHLTVIAATQPVSDAQFRKLTRDFAEATLLFLDAHKHERIARLTAPYVAEHTGCLPVTGGLARAATVFTLCHELAHIQLGHLTKPPSIELELEADRHAARLFLSIVERGEVAYETTVYIDPKVMAGPLLLPRFLECLEGLMPPPVHGAERQIHPSPMERLDEALAIIGPMMNPTAQYLQSGLMAALEDIEQSLGLHD